MNYDVEQRAALMAAELEYFEIGALSITTFMALTLAGLDADDVLNTIEENS